MGGILWSLRCETKNKGGGCMGGGEEERFFNLSPGAKILHFVKQKPPTFPLFQHLFFAEANEPAGFSPGRRKKGGKERQQRRFPTRKGKSSEQQQTSILALGRSELPPLP